MARVKRPNKAEEAGQAFIALTLTVRNLGEEVKHMRADHEHILKTLTKLDRWFTSQEAVGALRDQLKASQAFIETTLTELKEVE